MAKRKSNKQIKQMLCEQYKKSFSLYTELSIRDGSFDKKRVWAFDRLRLCENGFKRKKLRFDDFSVVSIGV